MTTSANTRWSSFRTSDEAIPSTPYEACVFLQNARLHMLSSGKSSYESRLIISLAHEEVNRHFFDSPEVAA